MGKICFTSIRKIILFGLIAGYMPLGAVAEVSDRNLGIIPAPLSVKVHSGYFQITNVKKAAILYETEADLANARLFQEYLCRNFGLDLPVTDRAKKKYQETICFQSSGTQEMGAEAYHLLVTPSRIEIRGKEAGGFYGLQSLMQMCSVASGKGKMQIPCAEIDDAPRFVYRGIMQEVGYHIFPVEFIKRQIDLLAKYKLNVYHWHLTEDHGWRIEIKKYPKLMEVGAYRAQTCVSNYDEEMTGGDGIPYGGYYTQEEVKDIVAYAQARHVAIIPEIELPGHSLAALASYPHLACGDQPGPFRVAEWWGIYEDVYCAGKEETFRFLEDVLTEVMELFPGKYIHIGGDECPKERWKKCAYCQKRIKEEGLKDEFELQSYFVKRIEKFVNEKGREIIGWDEILEGGLAPRATVMNWRDTSEGIKAARQHHDVIMAPNAFLYFDYIQGDRAQEPLAIGWGYNPTERVYVYEPVPEQLAPEHRPYIIGVEAPLWTEHIDTYRKAEYMLFPRLMALSEIAWSVPEVKDLKNFKEERLPVHLAWLDTTGIIYRVPEPIGMERDTLYGTEFTVSLKVPVEGGKIYYNFEGQPARETDYLYEKPFRIIVPEGQKRELKAITVAPSGKRSITATTIFIHQKSK